MRLSDFELVTIELDGGGETLKAGQLVSGRVRAQLKESPMKVKGKQLAGFNDSETPGPDKERFISHSMMPY